MAENLNKEGLTQRWWALPEERCAVQSEERGRTGAQNRGGRSPRRGVWKCRRVQCLSIHVCMYTHIIHKHTCAYICTQSTYTHACTSASMCVL